MGEVRELVAGVVGVLFALEMLLMLLPEGAMKKYARLAAGLALLLFLLSPLQNCSGAPLQGEFPAADETPASPDKNTYTRIIEDVYNRELENRDN